MTGWAVRELYDRETPAEPAEGIAARVVTPVLRTPLLLKLLGANLLIVLAVVVQPYLLPGGSEDLRLATAVSVSFAVTAVLIWLALRPITLLEATAERVSAGDFAARVPLSGVADNAMMQLSKTMNRLLDRVEADRARIQYLAGRSVRARDIERESVARELRDSLAQMVSAIALQLAVIRAGNVDEEMQAKVESARQLVADLTDQMRGVAESLYPGTIGEFAAALTAPLPPAASGALYRVAEEALRNVAQHSQATHVHVSLSSSDDEVTLSIEDDGKGMDLKSQDVLQAGLGLFSAQTVLALAGGELQVSGAPGRGTRISARIPATQLGRGSWRQTS
jgi:two-component system sensor histidine kinase UhpB